MEIPGLASVEEGPIGEERSAEKPDIPGLHLFEVNHAEFASWVGNEDMAKPRSNVLSVASCSESVSGTARSPSLGSSNVVARPEPSVSVNLSLKNIELFTNVSYSKDAADDRSGVEVGVQLLQRLTIC
jgi:hypothetical protein